MNKPILENPQEQFKKEDELSQYKGKYKVVSSHELKKILEERGQLEVTTYSSGFPFLDAKIGGFQEGELITVTGYSGHGKCHGKGTKILMYNGSIKNVEDICIGEELMGDDSTPRKVLSLARGREMLYNISSKYRNTESYIVNESHMLSLWNMGVKAYGGHGVKDISVKDYLSKSKSFKGLHVGYKASAEFAEQDCSLDPYFIGLWLGDGNTNGVGITTMDQEIVDYLYSLADKLDLKVTVQAFNDNKSSLYSLVREKKFAPTDNRRAAGYGKIKSLTSYLQDLNLLGNKHIPDTYKINSRKNRLKLLAGLIDSDGHRFDNCYEIICKKKELKDDIVYLCRSLGIWTNTGIKHSKKYNKDYFRICLSGEMSEIPVLLSKKKCYKRKQIKNALHYSINVEQLEVGDYYGFELDGNHRYLLGDFSVTHNTSLCQSLTASFAKNNVPTLWFSYEVSPAQFFKKFDEPLPLFFLPQELEPYDLEWFKERVVEGIVKHDVRIIFIDHLHFLLNLFQSKNSSLDIGSLLRELKTFCLKYSVVIFLVAHTKQPKATEEPDMGSLRDSSFIVQESDKVLAVHRVRSLQSRSKVIVLKDRDHGESMGCSVDFFLNEKSKMLQETPMERQGAIIEDAKNSRKMGEAILNEEDIKAAESLTR